MLNYLGFTVFMLAMLSLLMACGAVVWIAINFQKLMKILATAVIDLKQDEDQPTTNEQLIAHIALANAVRMRIKQEDCLYESWKQLPQSVRDAIQSDLMLIQETRS